MTGLAAGFERVILGWFKCAAMHDDNSYNLRR